MSPSGQRPSETVSIKYFDAIYDRSVGLAFVLATAGGLDLPTTSSLEKIAKGISLFTVLKSKWEAGTEQVADLSDEIKKAESDLRVLDKEIKETLGEIGECPMCGASQSDGSPHLSVVEMGGV